MSCRESLDQKIIKYVIRYFYINPTVLTADFSVQSTSEGIDYFISPELYTRISTASNGSSKHQSSTNSSVNVYLSL